MRAAEQLTFGKVIGPGGTYQALRRYVPLIIFVLLSQTCASSGAARVIADLRAMVSRAFAALGESSDRQPRGNAIVISIRRAPRAGQVVNVMPVGSTRSVQVR